MEIKLREPYPKQKLFLNAKSRYVAYGGARGGGKSWAARVKCILLALNNAGIQILLMRRTLSELRENQIIPMQKVLMTYDSTKRIAKYREHTKEMIFPNGSRIVLGYMASENDALQYQGQSYDIVFMEEATQFTETQFIALTECNRSSGLCTTKIRPRMYFTCNPGGVGHNWFKRLFIDRDYKNSEHESDYEFIQATVYDNNFIMENSPDYVRTLENLPENRRKAMLDGDWNVFSGQYFDEFDTTLHVTQPFAIPNEWKRHLSIDYGLDMLAALWIAVDFKGNAWVYREIHQPNLRISEAAKVIRDAQANEHVDLMFCPPDLFNRRQETGKSAVEIFNEHGLPFHKSSNDRIQGWYALKEWLKPVEIDGKTTSRMKFFSNCTNLIKNIPLLQFDEKKVNDVSKTPHDITHIADALRGFVVGNHARPVLLSQDERDRQEYEREKIESFLNYGV